MVQQPSTQQLADEFDAFVAQQGQQGQQSGGGGFASNEDAARWLDAWMRQIDRKPVEQTFRQGLQMGAAGTAGTLARSARLPFEFGDALLEWLNLGPEIAGPVKAALDATTAGGRMVAGLADAGGQALQGYAQRVGQEFDEPTFAGALGQAAGSAAVMAPASIVGGALGPAVGIGARLAGSLAGGGVGASIASEGLLERAEGLGAGPGQRMGAMAAGVPIGAVEAFGAQKYLGELGQILKGGSREVVQRVALELSKAAGSSFVEEGGEELVQGLAEEAVAAWILEDPEARDRDLGGWLAKSGEVAIDEGLPAGVIGALMGGMARAGAIQQARGQVVKPAPLVDQIEPAMQEDAKRSADPEWAGVREAMEGQNQTPLRFVQPATEDQKRTATLAQRLGVEVGFVEPYTPSQEPGQTASAETAVDVSPQEVTADTETDTQPALTPQVSESDLAGEQAVTVAEMPTEQTMFGPVERQTKGAVRGGIVTPTVTQPNLLDIQKGDIKGQRSMLDEPEVAPKPKRSGFADRKSAASRGELGFRAWVRSMGGLNIKASGDLAGEVRGIKEIGDDGGFGLGPLVRGENSDIGVSVDAVLEAAMERGYLPEGSGVREVLALIDSDYTPEKAERDAQRETKKRLAEDEAEFRAALEDAGLPPTATIEDLMAARGQETQGPSQPVDDVPFAASQSGPLRYPAAYMRGRVAIDARSATPKRLLFHEGLHHLAANNAPGFARLLAAMTDLKPEKIAAARRAYAQAFGEGAPTGAALDEEAAAVFSEDLAGVLEKAFDDPAKLTRVLSDRNLFEVVRDWIARVARTFGGSMQTTIERRLAAIGAADDAEVKLALLWKDTIDAIQSEMRASEAEAAVRDDAKFVARRPYMMSHQPSEDGPPLHDLTKGGLVPDDIYTNPQYYAGDPSSKWFRETVQAIRAARGKPEAMVTIYRAAPPGTGIEPGNWVTLSREYAKQHGRVSENPSEDMPVYSMRVPAAHVRFAGDDLSEFGYFPPDVRDDAKFAAAYHGSPSDHNPEALVEYDDGRRDYVLATQIPEGARVIKTYALGRFRLDKIGTGEGAQAYGWGLYFASNREVAEHYRKKLTNPRITLERVARDSYNSDMEPDEALDSFLADVAASPGLTANERALVAQVVKDGLYGFDYPHQAIKAVLGNDAENYDLSPEIRPILEAIKTERRGRLYEVELAPAEDEYLLWDKPLSEQSEKVKAALGVVDRDFAAEDALLERARELGVDPRSLPEYAAQVERMDASRQFRFKTGEQLYREKASDPGSSKRAASLALRSAGIRGIKYLDGSSRAQGDGNYNYVIFDEADVTVKAKFAVAPPTDSPEFKRWFGDSKVVNRSGSPKIVYHGTREAFSEFELSDYDDVQNVANDAGAGFFFAELIGEALYFTRAQTSTIGTRGDYGSGASVMPVFLSLQNPRVFATQAEFFDAVNDAPYNREGAGFSLRALLQNQGFDGVVIEESEMEGAGTGGAWYIAFRSEQIKSATGNRGTFDPANPDIRFAADRSRIEAAAAQARAEGEETEIGSRPSRIADTSADPDQRAMRRGVREVRAESEQVVTLKEQRRRAESVTNEEAIEKARSGAALQAHEQIALDRARVEHTTAALQSGSEADIQRAIDTEWTYQDVRRDTARALGSTRDALRAQTPAETVAEFAFEMSPDLRIRIERATKRLKTAQENGRTQRVAIEQATIKRLKGIEAQRVQKAIAALKAQGFDPALLTADYLNDPTIAARIARTIYTSKSPKFDWFKEFTLSNMLSALGTQVVNPTGNFVNTSVEQVATRLGAAMANTVVRDPNSPSWAETAAFYKAFNAASMKAGRVFLQSMRTDMPVFEIELRRQGVVVPEDQGAKLDVGRAAIPGAVGRAIRFPSLTMMRATDEAARAFSYVTEGTALAFRAAKNEGATGDALAARTLEILNGPYRADVHGAALETADRMTFRDKDDPVTRKILEVRRMADSLIGTERHGFFPAGTMFMPFVSFGVKSLRAAVGLPIHPAVTVGRLLRRAVNQGPYVGDTPRAVQDLGRSIVSALLLYGLYSLIHDDDDRGVPRITGTARPYERDNAVAPPMSVRIGDRWYSYERLDPASTSIATIVDALQEGDIGAGFARALHSLGNTVADKSYLATLGTIVDALSEPDAETWQERAAKFGVRSLMLPMIPNLVRSTATATDEFQRTTAARKEHEDDGVWDVMGRELEYRILPTGARAPAIKYDTWGRPMARPGRSFFERLLSPVKTTGKVEDANDIDVLIWRFNQRYERGEIADADARRYVPRPPDFHYTNRDGSKGYWTDEEYERLQREAGQEALDALRGRRLNFESPEWDDIERVRKAISDARSRVKRSILRESQAAEVAQQ